MQQGNDSLNSSLTFSCEGNSESKDVGTNCDDLILYLKLCYDPSTFSRFIGDSLISTNEENVESDTFNREFDPDKECEKFVIENTHFAEIINEASLIIAQIASGVTIHEKGSYWESREEYNYPEKLKNAGLLPLDVIRSRKGDGMSNSNLIKMKSPLNKILITRKKITQFISKNEQKITNFFTYYVVFLPTALENKHLLPNRHKGAFLGYPASETCITEPGRGEKGIPKSGNDSNIGPVPRVTEERSERARSITLPQNQKISGCKMWVFAGGLRNP